MQSPVRGCSRGNTPDPAMLPDVSLRSLSPPDRDESSEDSKVRIT